jgi:hypothetical protein
MGADFRQATTRWKGKNRESATLCGLAFGRAAREKICAGKKLEWREFFRGIAEMIEMAWGFGSKGVNGGAFWPESKPHRGGMRLALWVEGGTKNFEKLSGKRGKSGVFRVRSFPDLEWAD